MYIGKLDDTVNEYNDTYYRKIKKISVDVKSSTCNDFSKEVNDKNRKFPIGDIVRISKYKNIFTKNLQFKLA